MESKSKVKTQYKSIVEVDAEIQRLEKQVDSGTMKLADEKRALGEITNLKRLRKNLEDLGAKQRSVDEVRISIDELRKQLDDPELKALSNRMDGIKAELDGIRKNDDDKFASRKVLVDDRNQIKSQLDDLFQRKRESAQNYKTANDRYWERVRQSRTRRAEQARAQKLAEEQSKRMEIANQLRETAAAPAYQKEIEDCQTLVDYFSGRATGIIKLSTSDEPIVARNEIAGVPKLELRQVDIDEDLKGLIPRKKKGEEEEAYFIGVCGKKGRKGGNSSKGANTPPSVAASAPGSGPSLHVPLPTLAALLSLSIPPPSSQADVPRVIQDLRTKKAWYEANQELATKANIALAEKEIEELFARDTESFAADDDGRSPIISEKIQEPTSTLAVGAAVTTPTLSDEVEEKLEKEAEA